MTGIILAAGLGTRLKPWTLTNPKALVPVEGVPMLQRIIEEFKRQGINHIIVNVHHFGDKIIDFLMKNDFGVEITVSDERDTLLDTGGAIVKILQTLKDKDYPLIIHNVDILSNADLSELYKLHSISDADVSLLVSERDSSRKLLFDKDNKLRGWHDLRSNNYRFIGQGASEEYQELAFSGIYVINKKAVKEMKELFGEEKFPIMEYFLSSERKAKIQGVKRNNLILLDIGKPASLAQASDILKSILI